MKVAVLLAVLALAASGEAIKCYTCVGAKVGNVDIGKVIGTTSCSEFDPNNPDKKFETTCADTDKGCSKVVDNDKSVQIRACTMSDKNECNDIMCNCSGDLCNGSERGWPSAVLLLAALAAALGGGR